MEAGTRELEFVETLGSGGFGSVYLANLHGRDRFVRRVAVKVMREGLDATAELVARQKDEARLLGLLAHDAIVQVLDLTEVEGRPAVVMEYVEGVDLSEILRRVGPGRLSRRAVVEIACTVAGVLDAAWNAPSPVPPNNPLRVIHRDIKPANILVTSWGRVKVLDFGVAKADFARDGRSTNAGWGTPRFMAPEQWLGEPAGPAIDVYALGVTLFELVADRPWERPPLARTPFEHHIGAQLQAQAAVPEPILDLIAAMTAFEAQDRPSAAEVHDRLTALIPATEGEPLATLARRELPAILEARRRELARNPLPAVAALGGISPVPSVRPVSQPPPVEEPSLRPSPASAFGDAARLGLIGAVFGVAALAAVTLAAALRFGPGLLFPEPEPAPKLADEAAPAPAATPIEPAPVTPAPPTVTASETPSPSRPPSRSHGAPGEPASPRLGPVAATEPASPPPAAPAATSAVAPPADVGTPAEAAKEPAVEKIPFDIVTVPMGADVSVDGVSVGRTPVADYALTAGSHLLVVTLQGQSSDSHSFTVRTGGPTGLRYTFSSSTWNTLR